MQTIIKEALKNAEQEKQMTRGVIGDDDLIGKPPRIVIVGCGGAGNNTINRLYHMKVSGAETIAVNTDKQHLEMIQADKRVLVGKSLTKGLGAGGDSRISASVPQRWPAPPLKVFSPKRISALLPQAWEVEPVPVSHRSLHRSQKSRAPSSLHGELSLPGREGPPPQGGGRT